MSKYLSRLKSEKQSPHELQKPQKAPSCSFCSTEGEHILKIQDNPPPRRRPDRPDSYEQQLADEAERRADFCNIHRGMLDGCQHFNVIERLTPGDQSAALDACLLWRLIRAGRNIEAAASAEIIGGVTVGDVLAWVSVNAKDVDAIRNERRLLLTCAESLQGAGHFWETIH